MDEIIYYEKNNKRVKINYYEKDLFFQKEYKNNLYFQLKHIKIRK